MSSPTDPVVPPADPVVPPVVTPDPAAVAWKPSFAEDGHSFAPNWLEKAPDDWNDVKGSFEGVTSLKAAGERIKGLRQSLSQKGILVPPDNASPEVKAAFLKDLDRHRGVPEKPEDYGLVKPENHQGPWDEEGVEEFVAMAPELGISKDAAKKLLEWNQARSSKWAEGLQAEEAAATKAEVDALVTSYGDKLDTAVALVRENKTIQELGWPADRFDPKSPEFVGAEAFKLLHKLSEENAKLRGQDSTRGNAGGASGEGKAWAESVISGKNEELAKIRALPHGDPRREDLERRIQAAYKSGLP